LYRSALGLSPIEVRSPGLSAARACIDVFPAFSKEGCTIFPQFPQLRFAVLTYVLTLA